MPIIRRTCSMGNMRCRRPRAGTWPARSRRPPRPLPPHRRTGTPSGRHSRRTKASRHVPAVARSTRAEPRPPLRALRTQLLEPLRQPEHPLNALPPADRQRLEQVASDCADLFQRSSSCVAGRNGQLSLHHHGRHRLSDRKLAALTAVHNFYIRRADGTTAAWRFFGRDHVPLFEQVIARVPLPPRPARRRPRPPKRPYLMPAAA